MLLRTADRAAYQLNLDRCLSHFQNRFSFIVSRFSLSALDRAQRETRNDERSYITLSKANPRISATCALSRSCSSALIVAFTTLCGLCDPMDLVSTFGIPTA